MIRFLKNQRDESGATLILALVFVLICSLALVSMVSLTGNDIINAGNLRNQRAVEYAAAGATDAAIQATRYTDNYYGAPAIPVGTYSYCMPSGVTSMTIGPAGGHDVVTVVCGNGTNSSGTSAYRTVNFYACQGAVAANSCDPSASPRVVILTAQVQYDDYLNTGYDNDQCNASTTTTCGTGMTIANWVVADANG